VEQLPVLELRLGVVLRLLLVPALGLLLVTGQRYWYSGGKEGKLKWRRLSTVASSLSFQAILLETIKKMLM
jgi:hypothetical protein